MAGEGWETALEELKGRLTGVTHSLYHTMFCNTAKERLAFRRRMHEVEEKVDRMIGEIASLGKLREFDLSGLGLRDAGVKLATDWLIEHPSIASSVVRIDVSRNIAGKVGLVNLGQALEASAKHVTEVVIGRGIWRGFPSGVAAVAQALRSNGGGRIQIRCHGDVEANCIACRLKQIPPGPRLEIDVDCWPVVTWKGAEALQCEALAEADIWCTVNAPGIVAKGHVFVPPVPEGDGAERIEVRRMDAPQATSVAAFVLTSSASHILFRVSGVATNIPVIEAALNNQHIQRMSFDYSAEDLLRAVIPVRTHLRLIEFEVNTEDDILRILEPLKSVQQAVCRMPAFVGLSPAFTDALQQHPSLHTVLLLDQKSEGLRLKKPFALPERVLDVADAMEDLIQDHEWNTFHAEARLAEARALLLAWRSVQRHGGHGGLASLLGFNFVEPHGAVTLDAPSSILDFVINVPHAAPPRLPCLTRAVDGWSTIAREMDAKKYIEDGSVSDTARSMEGTYFTVQEVVHTNSLEDGQPGVQTPLLPLSPLHTPPRSWGPLSTRDAPPASTLSSDTTVEGPVYIERRPMTVPPTPRDALQAVVGERRLGDEVARLTHAFNGLVEHGVIPRSLLVVRAVRARLRVRRASPDHARLFVEFTVANRLTGTQRGELVKQYKRFLSPRILRKQTVVQLLLTPP